MGRDKIDGGVLECVERLSADRLAETVPGSTRKWWLTTMIPQLVEKKVLRKIGNAWMGRRSEIESALLGDAA